MQGEPLLEGHVSPAAQAEDVVMESSAAERAQKAAEPTLAEEKAGNPAMTVAGETETPDRQTSPAPQAKEPHLLEVVADIGRSAVDEAEKIVASEGRDLVAGGTQGSFAVVEHSVESAPVEELVIEAKIPLQTMGPLPTSRGAADALLSSSNTLVVVSLLPDIGAPDPSLKDQQEILQMMKEDVVAREGRLADHKASLDAREPEFSLWEGNLEATLHTRDESLETLVQQRTKELKDEHGAALDTRATDHVAQLKKLVKELDAASSTKAEIDSQVAKLNEDVAGSAKEVEALMEEARQAELLLGDVQS
nr:uncharacterized protein LOC109744774 [Aegilops tauschii subsp. strangulata]